PGRTARSGTGPARSAGALLALELLRIPHVRPGALLRDREQLLGVVAIVVHPLVQEIAHREPPGLRVLDRFGKVGRLQRAHELDGAVAHAHELHPEALSEPRAVVALLRDGGLIPGGRPFLPGEDLADAAGEAALFRLDEVPDDLVRAPLVRVEMPRAVVAESAQLRLDEGAGGLEVLGDLTRGEVGRHETSCGALRTGTLTFSMTVPSARVSCVDSPRRSSRRSLRRRPDWSSPSGGSSFPSLCRRMSSVSSFQPIPRTMSLACAFSMRSTRESWIRRKIATSSSDGRRRSRPVLEKSIRTPCLSMRVCT